MITSWNEQLATVDIAFLSPLVRQMLDDPAAEVDDFTYQALSGGLELGSSVFRFAGQARRQGAEIPWSLILKVVGSQESNQEPDGIRYWQREALAYQSGLLANLPGGLTAPRCYAVEDRGEAGTWLWLQELHDDPGPAWTLEQYILAAHHLGQFNGAYLTGKCPLPEAPWIPRTWLRQYVEHAAPMIEFMRQNPGHPLVQKMYPGSTLNQIFMLWEARQVILNLLENLPQTFCHQDAFRRNLFALPGFTAAIDWTYTGIAPVGAELAPLTGMAVSFEHVPDDQMPAFDECVFNAYLEGLRQVGWEGNPKQVRVGYVWTFLMRYVYGANIGELFRAYLTGVGADVFEKGLAQSGSELAPSQGVLNFYNARMVEGFKLLSLPTLGRLGLRIAGYLLKRK